MLQSVAMEKENKSSMIRISVYLPPSTHQKLEKEADASFTSVKSIIRQAIENELDQRERLRQGFDIAQINPQGETLILVHSNRLNVTYDSLQQTPDIGVPDSKRNTKIADIVERPGSRTLRINHKPH